MTNEKYLSTDMEPLKAIGNGKVSEFINDFLDEVNDSRKNKAELVAYGIKDSYGLITTIECLFKTENGLLFRSYEFYVNRKHIEDNLKNTAEYGVGILDVEIENFFELRSFYLEKTNEHLSI